MFNYVNKVISFCICEFEFLPYVSCVLLCLVKSRELPVLPQLVTMSALALNVFMDKLCLLK